MKPAWFAVQSGTALKDTRRLITDTKEIQVCGIVRRFGDPIGLFPCRLSINSGQHFQSRARWVAFLSQFEQLMKPLLKNIEPCPVAFFVFRYSAADHEVQVCDNFTAF